MLIGISPIDRELVPIRPPPDRRWMRFEFDWKLAQGNTGEFEMAKNDTLLPAERIERQILLLRGEKVLLDADLAELYGVATKALNQAAKRNRSRFPGDFMFQLSAQEKLEVVTNCDHLAHLRFSPTRPFAFTEQGVAMLSSVLRSKRAVEVNVQIMRTFVRLRQLLSSNAALARKLAELEAKYDGRFKRVFEAIRQLMIPPELPQPKRRPIGYHSEHSTKE